VLVQEFTSGGVCTEEEQGGIVERFFIFEYVQLDRVVIVVSYIDCRIPPLLAGHLETRKSRPPRQKKYIQWLDLFV
jgi:hypothetical protein